MAGVNITQAELDGLDFMLGFVSLEAADFTPQESAELDAQQTAAMNFLRKARRALNKSESKTLVKRMLKQAREAGF